MRFSEILRDYYKIRMSEENYRWLDIYFTGAAHHYWRSKEAELRGECEKFKFHSDRLGLHVEAMRAVVYNCGDFSKAQDPSGTDLHLAIMWRPQIREIPDPDMFNSMKAHAEFALGEEHSNDKCLLKARLDERMSA